MTKQNYAQLAIAAREALDCEQSLILAINEDDIPAMHSICDELGKISGMINIVLTRINFEGGCTD